MKRASFFFLLIFLFRCGYSQTIYSERRVNMDREYKTKRPRRIVENIVFHNADEKETTKNVMSFDDAGMLILEERFDGSGTRTARFFYTNDTINRLKLSRSYERWEPYHFVKETTIYGYNGSKNLISITSKDDNGNVLRFSELTNNENGDPVLLVSYDEAGRPFGKETATYIYDQNKVVTSVISNSGRVLSSDTLNQF
jgi:hypothetical protein